MVRAAALMLALVQAEPDTGPAWYERYATYGVDITSDGEFWLNMDPTGEGPDYSVRLDDFERRAPIGATVWIRGIHQNDSTVSYRRSMYRYYLDCQQGTLTQLVAITYAPDGRVTYENHVTYPAQAIVPGSYAAQWQRFICRP